MRWRATVPSGEGDRLSPLLALPTALVAALPTTICVLALWVAHARVVENKRVDTVLIPMFFLFVPLIFAVSAASNVAAVLLGQMAGLVVPSLDRWVIAATAGVLVWCGCAVTQRGRIGFGPATAPVSIVPVALFSLVDALFLAGGLHLLPGNPIS